MIKNNIMSRKSDLKRIQQKNSLNRFRQLTTYNLRMEARTTYSIYIKLFLCGSFTVFFHFPRVYVYITHTHTHIYMCIFQSSAYLQILNSLSYFPCQEISLFCMMIYFHTFPLILTKNILYSFYLICFLLVFTVCTPASSKIR